MWFPHQVPLFIYKNSFRHRLYIPQFGIDQVGRGHQMKIVRTSLFDNLFRQIHLRLHHIPVLVINVHQNADNLHPLICVFLRKCA